MSRDLAHGFSGVLTGYCAPVAPFVGVKSISRLLNIQLGLIMEGHDGCTFTHLSPDIHQPDALADWKIQLGRLSHYAFDAVLISAFLAGIKRSTGLTGAKKRGRADVFRTQAHSPSLNADKITDSKDIKRWIESYLGVGEWVMDQSVAVLGSTSYFERRR
ncbi:hypothetical protein UA08_08151 [Talaromyces atroroseus]|uniref:DUF1748-domain-containing protein n=1 Tax=Talaromyces atroroseus TaxID=1441469 RepID=A0A225A9B0_TALAT|nr:hypothetical protein UA08_08151 [Talaromyces atroroseus]OKL56610.1 hypothetical protein UA08_08151 [Talaromyces atroroseus]